MGMPNRMAPPARFDSADRHRRGMLAKVHIAVKDLAMNDDDYRAIVFDVSGQMSAKKCTAQQLDEIIGRLKKLGWQPLPTGGPKPAMHPMARKARALWISLYHLGVVHNKEEPALEAFAKRQLGCERLVWARQSSGDKLIEALKNMATRNGWPQKSPAGRAYGPTELQEGLCEAILAKLQAIGAVPEDWALHHAMWGLCGIENARDRAWTADDYARLASALGAKLREAGGAQS